MNRQTWRRVSRVLLSGLWLVACSGEPEAMRTPSEELLGTQESAMCSGASVTSLTLSNISSFQGEVIGMGNWQVAYPANAVYLEYYIDGVRYAYGDRTPEEPTSNRAGGWHFSYQGIPCGSHTFEVRAWPVVLGSTSRDVCGPTPSKTLTQTFSEACPPCSATFSCEQGPTLSCTGASQCRQLGALDSKVCGGVECDGVAQYCPPLPGDLECF